MRHIVPLIWEQVEADTKSGRAVNIDDYCRKYCALNPEIGAETIRDVVRAAVAALKGDDHSANDGNLSQD